MSNDTLNSYLPEQVPNMTTVKNKYIPMPSGSTPQSSGKPAVFDLPAQERPYFIKSTAKKRIDYVLAFQDKEEHHNIRKIRASSRTIEQTIHQTREIYRENLERTYGFQIEEHVSHKFKQPVTFWLLHLPFEKLEVYANMLQINKRISQDYIALVDQVFKSDHNLHLKKNIGSMTPAEYNSLKEETEQAKRDYEEDRMDRGRDVIDEIEGVGEAVDKQANKSNCYQGFCGKWLSATESGLAEIPSYFTVVYDTNLRHLFHGINTRDNKTNEDDFFTAAERSKIADYLLKECPYITDPEAGNVDFGVERLLGIVGEVFTAAYPLHDCALKTEANSTYGNPEVHMRRLLYDCWGRYRTFYKRQPLDYIRVYFGEKIGLYFAWLGYYTNSLIYATIWGLLPVIYGLITYQKNDIVQDYCNEDRNTSHYRLCPMCDGAACATSELRQSCLGARFSWWFDNDLTLPYAIIMSLWAVLFLEFWKRKQFKLAYEWDLTDIDEDSSPVRPQYRAVAATKGVMRSNPITLEKERYVPMQRKVPAKIASYVTVFIFIVVVLAALISTIIYRLVVTAVLAETDVFKQKTGIYALVSPQIVASTSASIISVIGILLLNFVYDRVAIKLNDWECHRTAAKYEEALTYKMFWFQFANYYSPLIYIAFLKSGFEGYPGDYTKFAGVRWQGCDAGGCSYELAIQMIITMVAKQFILNIVEIWLPKIIYYCKKFGMVSDETIRQNGDSNAIQLQKGKGLMRWEEDYNLEPVVDMTLFYEYLEMAIQYGFVTLFVTAFPLSPLFALLNNLMEIKIDATKFLKHRQRAVAEVATNIGAWEHLLDIISHIAVVTNALVIALTSNQIKRMVYKWDHDDSLEGFVEFSLSGYNTTCFGTDPNGNPLYDLQYTKNNVTYDVDTCYHYGHRKAQDSSQPCLYTNTNEHWKDLCIRFLFILIMEHAIMIAQRIIDGLIPDRSKKLESEIKREKHLTKIIVKQAERISHLQVHKIKTKLTPNATL